MKTLFMAILFCWMTVCAGHAQMPFPPEDINPTNGLSVWLGLKWNTNNAVFHAPARIDMVGYVRLRPDPKVGDAVRVDFFADGKRLGSGKAVWHGEIRPHAGPGEAIPMWVMAAQF